MNEHPRLPSRDRLARPSRALGCRMDALFSAAATRPRPARLLHFPWRRFLAPAGLAAAVALLLIHPRRAGPHPPAAVWTETRELPADIAATLLPPAPAESEFSLSIRSN